MCDEHILVVKRERIFNSCVWQGLNSNDIELYQNIITCHGEFHPRSTMEQDDRFKQIIPYMIFEHAQSYFLMQRKANASEARLQNKFSLGIGGHVRKEDMVGKTIFDWAQREFQEEVHYSGSCDIEIVGVLNDDSNSVGKVHLGLVLLLHGDMNNISIKDEHKMGTLSSSDEIDRHFDLLEPWSQIVWSMIKST